MSDGEYQSQLVELPYASAIAHVRATHKVQQHYERVHVTFFRASNPADGSTPAQPAESFYLLMTPLHAQRLAETLMRAVETAKEPL